MQPTPGLPTPPGQIVPSGFDWMPVGTVTAFAGPVMDQAGATPATDIEAWGWMRCDGRQLQVAVFPELFAVLGHQYGGTGASFKIPDYRGMFLRGVAGKGKEPFTDPDIDHRKPPGRGKADQVGSWQSHALQTHVHDYKFQPLPSTSKPKKPVASAPSNKDEPTSKPLTQKGKDKVVVSDHETRPRNVFVNFIIKFTQFSAWTPHRFQPPAFYPPRPELPIQPDPNKEGT